MYPDWVPQFLRDRHKKTLRCSGQSATGFPRMFITRFATAASLDKFWKKYRKEFESDEECYRWVFKTCFDSYVDFESDPQLAIPLRQKQKKADDFTKAIDKVDKLAKELGLSGKLWNLLPYEYLEKACLKAATCIESEKVRENPGMAFVLDLDHYLFAMPTLTELLFHLKEWAYSEALNSGHLGSPNAQYSRVNFFVRAFYREAKKICSQPNYDRIADLANVLFPETEVDATHVRDRIKEYY
ncbi:MAG: hypothetical protein C9356_02595 [Oleiphilus sp.]|nr:MAG: hypothetical protein C9356_02595 [Oleiphilus sp.]